MERYNNALGYQDTFHVLGSFKILGSEELKKSYKKMAQIQNKTKQNTEKQTEHNRNQKPTFLPLYPPGKSFFFFFNFFKFQVTPVVTLVKYLACFICAFKILSLIDKCTYVNICVCRDRDILAVFLIPLFPVSPFLSFKFKA